MGDPQLRGGHEVLVLIRVVVPRERHVRRVACPWQTVTHGTTLRPTAPALGSERRGGERP